MQTKPLLNAMTGTLNKEQAKTLCQELNDVEAKALVRCGGRDIRQPTVQFVGRGTDAQGELSSLTTYQ